MTIRGIDLNIRGAQEKTFKNKDGEDIAFKEAYVGGDEFDSFTKVTINKVVPDGVHKCALKVDYDFEKKCTKVRVYVAGN